MADREVVGIELVAKLDQLRAEFKSLPKTTDDETKKAVSLALKNLSKLEKGAAKSAQSTASAVAPGAAKAADALKGLDESAKALGETAGDTDSSLKAVAGAVGLISPQAETALSSIGDLAGGLEGVVKGAGLAGVSLGGIALAAAGIAAVATAVYLVWDATEDARAKTREWEAALADVTLATRTLASAKDAVAKGADDIAGFVGDLQIQTALLRGEIDETDVKLGELGSRLADDLADDLAEANKALGEQSKQLQILYTAQADASLSAKELTENELAIQKAQANYDAIEGKIASLEELRITANAQIQEYGEALRESQEKEEKATKATISRASSTHEASAAVRDHASILRVLETSLGAASSAYEALSREESSSIAQLQELGATEGEIALARDRYAARRVELSQQTSAKVISIEQQTSASIASLAASYSSQRLSEEEKFVDDLAEVRWKIVENERLALEELAALEAEAKEGSDLEALAEIEAQKVELGKTTQAALDSVAREGSQRRQEMALAEVKANREAILSDASALSGGLATMATDLSTLIGDANAEAAQRAFKIAQGAAVAQTVVNTAQAVSDVWAEHAANPLQAIALSAIPIAVGVAQVAKIKAQQPAFHVGGIVPGYGASQGTGEVSARLLPDEVVLNRQAVQGMGGPEAANSLNHGGGMGGSITLNQVWRGSTLDRVVYDVSRLPGSKTRQLTQGGRVGKRTR